ncbi:SGNH/GDSL hydrolase family protein [Fluviispira sanaruensis]|uniref:GDSL family lipase n=1 Tax=Fluviispira sanaruensis TaxID=2493639 RepID=A0A4P2VY08_FLUSA|nr:SGNH/GDSL hydrolase family protein [Fluviispira sanaruensis]BBH53932.1 GDSL family lipase [Fluviispira sanaruensis]
MKKIITAIVFLSITCTSYSNGKNSENNINFERLYVLGDSLSDTGAATGAITKYLNNCNDDNLRNLNPFFLPFLSLDPTISSLLNSGFLSNTCSNLPKEISFDTPAYMTRSFTNGKVAAEILAEKMSLELTPAWKVNDLSLFGFVNFKGSSQIGTNYAFSGAKAAIGKDLVDTLLLNKFALNQQLSALLAEKGDRDLGNDLFLIMIGANDIISATFNSDNLIIDSAVLEIEKSLLSLYNGGARNFIISNVPNIALLPLINPNLKPIAEYYSKDFNFKLNAKITDFKVNYGDANITYIDLYQVFDDLKKESSKKGMNFLSPCTTNISDSMINSVDFSVLLNTIRSGKLPFVYINGCSAQTINNHFFFDSVHPTSWGQEKLGNKMYELLLENSTKKN